MKLIKGLIIFTAIWVVFSCATTQNSSVTEPDATVETEVKSDKNMVEKTVEEKVYYPVKIVNYYGDGQIDTIVDYTYNDNSDLVAMIETNEQGEVLESHRYTHTNGFKTREDSYGFGNVLNSYTLLEYDQNGLVIRETLYDKADKVQSINEFEYSAGNLTVWKTLSGDGGVLAITTYEYDKNGNNTVVKMNNGLGAVDGVIEKSYKKDLIVKEDIKDSKGSVEKSATYSYKNDKLIEKIYLDNKGKVKRGESYEYNESIPLPVKINQNYASGAVEAYSELSYDFKIVEKTILVEE